jgi:thiol-disulfide isomerase/thioredoxin
VLGSIIHRLPGEAALPVEGRLASFAGATGWLNSEPLTPEALRGRVVLVDFWTYTCVNWLRTLPYVRAWDAKYRSQGLAVVGAHTPEFGFEHDVDNVTAQTRALGVTYPVAIDSDYGVWRAFDNHYWPAAYVADVEGNIRFHHFGEGEYEMTEMVIQQLLAEAGADVDRGLVSVQPSGLEVSADWRTVQSGETYTGYLQATGFAQADVARFDEPSAYTAPARLGLNDWALTGNWTVTRAAAISNEPAARLAFEFHARDVNLVMGPSPKGTVIPFRVSVDGQSLGDAHGADADPNGGGTLDQQRTYQLVRQPGPIADRRFEIEFLEPGAEAYCFTFG